MLRRSSLLVVVVSIQMLTALGVFFPAFGATFPAGFAETAVFTGHSNAVAVRFAPNGQIFVAEQSGFIWVYENLNDTTASLVVDLRVQVYASWDRGLLGMTIDPGWPAKPYLYVLYSHDVFADGTGPRWGTLDPISTMDTCPSPPGATADGCVVYGRLSRIVVDTSIMIGVEEPLLQSNWCLQYPSHSTGDVVFGDDGYLYASAGDGASFNFADWGQDGNPLNPCDDPPDGIGGPNSGVTGAGGALRSQDILTPSDPTSFDGTVLRIDVSSGVAVAPSDNPLVGNGVAGDDFIIAIGLRNPYRINKRPGTGEIWVGDVGWSTWEEINRITDVTGTVENFGWPCYEGNNSGSAIMTGYDQQLMCVDLYAGPPAIPAGIVTTAPYFAYHHQEYVPDPDTTCGRGGSAVAGIAFNTGSNYPSTYDDALAYADSSRRCVWLMLVDGATAPDPNKNNIIILARAANRVVDVQMGPDGNYYYIEYHGSNGKIWRVEYTPTNDLPLVFITKPLDGAVFTTGTSIDFAGSASDTEDGSLTSGLAWTSSIDTSIGSGGSFSFTLSRGTHTIVAEATDTSSDSGSDSISVTVHDPPSVSITAPSNGHTVTEGDNINFTGTASDTEDGNLTASITWNSDFDGDFGTGGSVNTSTLSVGTHTITASVNDSQGVEDTDTISVTVNTNSTPNVNISAPADGAVFVEGTSIGFTGSASDNEDGNLTSSLSWDSSRDGDIGSGGSFSKVLTVGDHTITASVTDSHGAGNSDSIDITINAPPTVSITGPANGLTVVEGTTINFTGTASDPEDGTLTASISWNSSLNGDFGTGGSVSTSGLSVGTHTITAEITDSHGETRTDVISVTVNANTVPNVAITSPANGSVFVQGTSIGFAGTATDNEDGNISGNLAWNSNRDGGIGAGASFSKVLSVGVHTVTASVTDSHGAGNSAAITVTVNAPPSVSITGPADGVTVVAGTSIAFSGTANDNEDGVLTGSIDWTSSIDSSIGTGGSFSTTLSVGTHTITAAVTDSHGETRSDNITVTVNDPPTVSITAPANGHTVTEGTSISFAGTANDTEDGVLTGSIDWTSSIDGSIGTGSSFSATLNVGTHTITASVTDSDGETRADNITVIVNANNAPDVTITSPADGTVVLQGTSISFAGTANDDEDGDLTGSLSWTSSIDGSIGSGGSFSATLSVGTHTITASVTDSNSDTGSDSITVTVNAPPSVSITGPPDGYTVVEGTSIGFSGTANDNEDGTLTGSLSWTSNIDGTIGSGGSFSDVLTLGTHTITASVTDSHGAPGSDSITVTVNAPPSVTITGPADGHTVVEATSINFSGTASDNEDGVLTGSLDWTSNRDGTIGAGGSFAKVLSVGTHTVTASVTDTHGETRSDSITVTVTGNSTPNVTITGPPNGHTVVEGTSISFSGTANDTEDGVLTGSLSWTSSIDGAIGSGGSFSTSLSIGTHTVTASVTDSHGAGGSDSITVTVNANTPPDVSITSPTGGTSVVEGISINFVGTANDLEDGVLSGSLAWTSSLDGSIGSGSSFSAILSVGTHTVTAAVTDSHGAEGSESIIVTVNANTAPNVTITAPGDGTVVLAGASIAFAGTANDGEDGDLTNSLGWSSSLDGTIGSGGAFSTTLSVGTHLVTASATDSHSETGSAAITLTVNDPPVVAISAPSDGLVVVAGTSIGFTGSASDTEDGDLTTSLAWNSSIEGAIGSGGSFSSAPVVGIHTITASVTDSHGETRSDSITVTVNDPPGVTITAPANGHTVSEAASITFAGAASDTEDGDLTGSLSWTSSLDGPIGSGGSFSQVLSVGTHTVTASVTDSHGETRSDSITVIVNANDGPDVSITDPANGTIFLEGASINFAGTANDNEDGDLTGSLSWSSSIDGTIGAGGSFSTTLSIGTHTITASVTDSHGDPGSAAISLTVDAEPIAAITAPADGYTVAEATSISFAGTASDTEDGDLSGSLTWTSSLDGAIGSGASFSKVLSVGTHTVTASVTDSQSQIDSDSISVTVNVNQIPNVTVTSPADNTVFLEGTSVAITGTAADNEDGNLTGDLSWTSNLDGPIGSGGSFSSTLSVGTHTVTAAVTDSHGANGSDSITVTVNAPPDVSITAPPDGHTVVEETTIAFAGVANDTEDGDLTASLSWVSSLDGAIGTGGSFSTTLSVGTHTVTATVTDSHGETRSDSISVTVTGNGAPSVNITSPADNTVVEEGTEITFVASAEDEEDGDLSGSLSWTSSIDGPMGPGTSFTSTLTPGVHTITASVTDSHGEPGSDAITVTVNVPPVIAITGPADGHIVVEGTSIDFFGTASDDEDGDLSGSLAWSSSIDGAMGSGASLPFILSVGSHTITASVTDSLGATRTDTINVVVNAPPDVTITLPATGHTVSEDTLIDFAGTANDAEDGDLGSGLSWTSSIDGTIGTGTALPTVLSVGTHTVTASVTDSDGASDSDSITVTVNANQIPAVAISAPADGAVFLGGSTIAFSGTASDNEDGDLSANLGWISSIDGAIGAGAGFSVVLSVGTHTISAAVTDSHGADGTASITVMVNAPPTISITSPADGSISILGVPINLAGTATDTEDGDLSASIVWTSSLDGLLGVGGSLPSLLTQGTHTITAAVTDSHGETRTDTITVTVLGPGSEPGIFADGFESEDTSAWSDTSE